MTYEVLARKWRPQLFDHVVGQEHVSTTLANSLASGRVGHAYLFTGIRGVGKTTTARILAKAVNCVNGPTPTPCGKCTPCLEITRSVSMDCLEIDGASNRGVEEIRNLREKIGYAPVGGKRKVYIIDEVHMLTAEAFNALLKTLEEPPSHALFIFATTDTRRVPKTILSRCQRFHFRRIPTAAIEEHLGTMVKEEKLRIAPDAIALVARRGDGSLRDAESLLEQVSSLAADGRAVTAAEVREFLGLLEEDQVFEAGRALVAGEGERVLALLEALVRNGGDAIEFAEALTAHFRNLMVGTVAPGSPALSELSSEEARRYGDEAARLRGTALLPYLDELGKTLSTIRRSPQPRLELEVALLTLAGRGPVAATGTTAGAGAEGPATTRPAAAPGARSTPPKAPARSHEAANRPMESAPPDAAPRMPNPMPSAPRPRDDASLADSPLVLEAVHEIWGAFLDEVKRKKRALGHFIEGGAPARVDGAEIVLGFPDAQKYSMKMVDERENRLLLAGLLGTLLGRPVTLTCDRVEGAEPFARHESTISPQTPATGGVPAASAPPAAPSAETRALDPGLQAVLDAFEGRILDVRATEPGSDQPGGIS